MPHYLIELTPPKQVLLGYDGQESIYQDCGGCGESDTVIDGAIADDDMKVCIIRHTERPYFENAYYCQTCFGKMRLRHRCAAVQR